MIPCPPVDSRTALDILADLRALQGRSIDRDARGADEALARIFATFCEILIDRLNRAPEKSFYSFLDVLGVSLLPAQPARVPLTFYPAATTADVVVPELTQVAAEPRKGDTDPVIFETERELVLLTGKLDALFVRDGARGLYADCRRILEIPGSEALPAFRGNQVIPHALYVGLPLPADAPVINSLRITFVFEGSANRSVGEENRLAWEVLDGKHEQPVAPVSDTTAGLRRSGDVVFENIAQIPFSDVDGVGSRWLRCRMLGAMEAAGTSPYPVLQSVRVQSVVRRGPSAADAALFNATPLDVTKEFFPFGERPRLGDTLYIASDEAFGISGTEVTIQADVVEPAPPEPNPALRPVRPRSARLAWEVWDGTAWVRVDEAGFTDETAQFTRSGVIRFRLPVPVVQRNVFGVDHRWLRVRIISGDYGTDIAFEQSPGAPAPELRPSTLAPPVLRSLTLSYALVLETAPLAVIALNDFRYVHASPSAINVVPFVASPETDPACYIGLDAAVLPTRSIAIYVGVSYPIRGQGWPQELSESASVVAWEYWNGFQWTPWIVRDETLGFRRAGIVRLLPPGDMRRSSEFGINRYWWRIRRQGAAMFEPRITMMLANTVMATQSQTTVDEVLGSSNARPGLRVKTSRAPVLAGQQLEVLERNSRGQDEWVTWTPVGSFYLSGPFDRVYVFDYAKGEVTFGDGVHGAIPQARVSNIRMKRYATGGGVVGNRPAKTITQLKTTVPYVQSVTNFESSAGGAAAEGLPDLLHRGPRDLRHRNRAVTYEDYEDLAVRSTSEVARAKCVPLVDLAVDSEEKRRTPGVVSIIIVPRSTEPAAVPSLELLDRVRRYIKQRHPPDVRVVLVGPDYVGVDVTAEIAVEEIEGARDTELGVKLELERYLNPITGRNGAGWNFGATPKTSDLYAVIESIPGVDHVRSLQVKLQREGATGRRTLIYAGDISVAARLEE